MALPNYSPSGVIQFGSVPWSNDYGNVRLYTSLSEQSSDIASMMTIQSNSYSYIARERRLKVSIEADRLYHCNYCMYRNNSLTDGYIYCFVSNVTYINDNTSEITLETDVFQTYLYGVDWTIPACFIERATVASESEQYIYTTEPDFPLTYVVDGYEAEYFHVGGWVIMTAAYPEQNDSLIDDILNPMGWAASPTEPSIYKGIANGVTFYYAPALTAGAGYVTEDIEYIVNGLESAGSVDSIVAIFTIPDFAASEISSRGFFPAEEDYEEQFQDQPFDYTTSFVPPEQGTSLDDYTPHNAKLLYYPYNFLRISDWNGSEVDLRYELFDTTPRIGIRYEITPTCEAIVYPTNYSGVPGVYYGFTTDCGAQGSWTNDAYTTWLAQNSGTIALTAAGIVLAGVTGGVSVAGAAGLMRTAQVAAHGSVAGTASGAAGSLMGTAQNAGMAAAGGLASLYGSVTNAMHQPTATRGQTSYDLRFMAGLQGVFAMRMCLKSEIARQIDEFFDQWGYAVERVEEVNITSRPSWNFVKTGGAAPRSTNVAAGTSAPFTRGRGTPAEALAIIKQTFDGGVTFWHTTSGFGNYALDNTL